ncbi:hypothetical protein NW755_011108 [Fusarium falciforme]|uniref:Uncharacterized protein n=1 Tax=Fusarium falciforme TaxID=195108 RepID=A0A9W8QYG9_9HYPO|nr:hypothetical protein NW755_011108 [Fusarium falciforme]
MARGPRDTPPQGGCLRGMLEDLPIRRAPAALVTARLLFALFKPIDKVSPVFGLGRL